jgi:hypothetical protein
VQVIRRAPSVSVLLLATLLAACGDHALTTPTVPLGDALASTAATTSGSPDVVISQVYGGGGNTGAPYTHDYVELFNRGAAAVSLAGRSIQFASATGTGNFGATSSLLTELPSVMLQPGQYFLVQQAAGGGNGEPLPTPDLIDATPTNMAAGAGKVVLVEGTASLACNGGSTPCSAAQLARIIDLVGYGNANFFEGAAAAPTLSNTTAALRAGGGCTDTDHNAADFSAAAPAPRNTAAPRNQCATDNVPPTVVETVPASGAANVAIAASITLTFSEPVTVTGDWFGIACTVSGAVPATVSGGPTTFTLDPDSDFAGGEVCTVTVYAAGVADQGNPPLGMEADYSWSFTTAATTSGSPDVVISQVYGGGGNTGAPYTHDYVELFNRGAAAVSLAGRSIQFASATGTGNFGATSSLLTELPSVMLQPGQYFLVQQAAGGGNGEPLPTPDLIDATPTNMAAGAGKVVLVEGTASLACNGGSTPCSAAQLARIIDLVGYGNANFFEGAAAAPTLSNTTAALRAGGGCTDTDHNAADFSAAAPAPRNTAAPRNQCATDNVPPTVVETVPASGAANVAIAASITLTFSEPVTVTGDWFGIACTVSGAVPATVSGGPTTFTLDPDSDFAGGEVCTVTVYAAGVADQGNPPLGMEADYSWSFTAAGGDVSPYPFSGFLPPVDAPPALNVVRAGQGVPVKFSLGGYRGLDIFASGYPSSRPISCDGEGGSNGNEGTRAAGQSSLSYDPETDSYTYMWKTERSWAGTCRELLIRFDDSGGTYYARFGFSR